MAALPEIGEGGEPAVADAAAARDLVALAQRGDRAAFARLVEDHYDAIYRTAYRWSGTRVDAEDIAQEVCVKLAVAIAKFDGRSAFSTWLYRVTLNTAHDLLRQKGRRLRQANAFMQVSAEAQPADQEEAMTLRQLWQAVRRLPDKQRDAVLLVYAEDLSHAAAADVMGCKEATVSWHIFEAKRALRGLL